MRPLFTVPGTEENRREAPSWEEYRSSGTRGSHPGIKVPDLPQGVRPIFHSPGGAEGNRRAPPERSTNQVVPRAATLELKFQTCLQGWGHILQSRGTEGNRKGSTSWEEYRSVVPVGSHPGIKVPDLSPGPISHSPGGLRELQPAWNYLLGPTRKASFSIINPLLTKLFQSWQNICLILCFLHVDGLWLHLDP